jgi:hypothetical protein
MDCTSGKPGKFDLDDDYFTGRVCAWNGAKKCLPLLPLEHLYIEINASGDARRQIIFKPYGKRYIELLENLRHLTE